METDALDYSLGVILSQQFTDGLFPIGFHSKELTPAQRNYPVHDKELLTIIEGFKTWRYYLLGAKDPIQVLSDHQPLWYFNTKRDLNAQQARWAEFLSEFSFWIDYCPGKQSKKPDTLSWWVDHVPTNEDQQDHHCQILHLQETTSTTVQPMLFQDILAAQKAAPPPSTSDPYTVMIQAALELIDAHHRSFPIPTTSTRHHPSFSHARYSHFPYPIPPRNVATGRRVAHTHPSVGKTHP